MIEVGTYMTLDNNTKEVSLENEAIALELLGDHVTKMPPPSTNCILDAWTFPLVSQPPALHEDHVAIGRVPQPHPPTPTLIHRSREKKQ